MNNTPDVYAPQTEKTKKNFSLSDAVMAAILFIMGYLMSSWVVFGEGTQGLGTLVVILLMSVISLVYLKIKKIPISKKSALQLILIIALSLPLVLSSDGFIKFLVTSYANICFVYWFFCATGNREEDEIGDMLFFEIVKSTLLLPFSSFTDIFSALGSFVKNSSFGKKLLLIFGGILVAIVPTAIISALLISADEAFLNLSEKLYNNLFSDLGKNIFYFIFGIPLAMYYFGMMFANITHEHKDTLTRENGKKISSAVAFVPATLTCASITPIILVYALFFFSQTSYFLSAFSGIRPEDITYAEYARKGFFELCGVSVINALVILCAGIFTKKSDNKRSPWVKGYIVALSFVTLALIAIALSKMFMYIDAYGLSILRIYPTWFMILLALVFVFILTKQICEKFNFARSLVVTFTVMFALLIFVDASALTAKYNIHCYEIGKFDTVDIWMMYDLSDSAVEYVIPLADDKDPYIAEMAKEYIEHKKNHFETEENTFANFNISTYRAKRAIEEYYAE